MPGPHTPGSDLITGHAGPFGPGFPPPTRVLPTKVIKPLLSRLLPFTLLAALACCGCTSIGVTADELPRDRIGSLPFPGLLSLYATADPDRLGAHRYGTWPRLFGDEVGHGIIYTGRAGFLDVAHIRISIDWARYCTRAVHNALENGRAAMAIRGIDDAVYHVTLDYPPGCTALPDGERGRLTDELSRDIGQRVAYLMMTWHEIDTWFGWRTVFFIDESPSAFTWDDSVSNLLGMRIAEAAMRDEGRGFDEAATAALDAELRRLGAVKPEQTDQATRAVEGRWWASGRPLKRHLDVYPPDTSVVYPWRVPGLPFCPPDVPPEPFPLPRVGVARGVGDPVTAVVEVEARDREARLMRELLPDRPRWFRDDRDVPLLIRAVREQMQAQYGPDVDKP